MTARRILQFCLIVLAWSTSWIIITLQLGTVNPTWSVGWRFLIGGVLLLGWCMLRGLPMRIPREGWPFVVAVALFQFVLNFNLVYRAEQYVTSGLVAAAFALLIVPNAILSALFLKRRVSRRFLAGSAFGIIGVGLLFSAEFKGAEVSGAALTGMALTVTAVLCASTANVLQGSRIAFRLPPIATVGWAMLLAGVANLLFAALFIGPPAFELQADYLLGAAALGIFASAIAFVLYYDLIRSIGPAEAAWTGVAVPIIAMLISTVLEGYRWTTPAVAGAIIALGGLVVALAPARKPVIDR